MALTIYTFLFLLSFCGMECGRISDHGRIRIVGGNKAEQGQFAYQLSIKCGDHHFCGAALLSPWIGLTAAHCCDKITQNVCQQDKISVIAGEVDLNEKSGNEQTRYLLSFIQHSGYKEPSFVNDICMLHFKEPFRINKFVKTIDVAQKMPYYGAQCNISGWGATSEDVHTSSPDLLFASVPIMDDMDCEEPYGSSSFNKIKMACAGYHEGGIDSCQGDSGGPLVCNNKLSGIVSFGSGCARPGFPGIYTKVPEYLRWIESATALHPMASKGPSFCEINIFLALAAILSLTRL